MTKDLRPWAERHPVKQAIIDAEAARSAGESERRKAEGVRQERLKMTAAKDRKAGAEQRRIEADCARELAKTRQGRRRR